MRNLKINEVRYLNLDLTGTQRTHYRTSTDPLVGWSSAEQQQKVTGKVRRQ